MACSSDNLCIANIEGKAEVRIKLNQVLADFHSLVHHPLADRNDQTGLFQNGNKDGRRNAASIERPAEQNLTAIDILRSGAHLGLDNDLKVLKVLFDAIV